MSTALVQDSASMSNSLRNLPLTIKNKQGDPVYIEVRDDGYVNATKLCTDMNREWKVYFKAKNTKDFLTALSDAENLPILFGSSRNKISTSSLNF